MKATEQEYRNAIKLLIGQETDVPFQSVPESEVEGYLQRIRELTPSTQPFLENTDKPEKPAGFDLESAYSDMCLRLRNCCIRHGLGTPTQDVAEIVVQALDKALASGKPRQVKPFWFDRPLMQGVKTIEEAFAKYLQSVLSLPRPKEYILRAPDGTVTGSLFDEEDLKNAFSCGLRNAAGASFPAPPAGQDNTRRLAQSLKEKLDQAQTHGIKTLADEISTFLGKLAASHLPTAEREKEQDWRTFTVEILIHSLWDRFNNESKSVIGTDDQQWASGLQRAVSILELEFMGDSQPQLSPAELRLLDLVEPICRAVCKVTGENPDDSLYDYESEAHADRPAGPKWCQYADAVQQVLLSAQPVTAAQLAELMYPILMRRWGYAEDVIAHPHTKQTAMDIRSSNNIMIYAEVALQALNERKEDGNQSQNPQP